MQKFPNEAKPQNKMAESNESFGTLLADLAAQSADLVRDEITLAKQELSEKVSLYPMPLVSLLLGGVIGLIAALVLCAALIIWVGNSIGYGLSAAIIGAVLAVIAIIILMIGKAQLSHLSLKPNVTIKTLEENTEWLKEMN